MKTVKFKILKGSLPADGGIDWWTKEDWDKHNAYVAELKAHGEYLKEDELSVTYNDEDPALKEFLGDSKPKESFGSFGILIPKASTSLPDIPKFGIKYKPKDLTPWMIKTKSGK